MSSLVHSQDFEQWGSAAAPSVRSDSAQPLRPIPPERVGLGGEYDHSGLAKRVEQAFRQQFQWIEFECLTIAQRGRVVVLDGAVANQALLQRLIASALAVPGANAVESFSVTVLSAADLVGAESALPQPESVSQTTKAIAAERHPG